MNKLPLFLAILLITVFSSFSCSQEEGKKEKAEETEELIRPIDISFDLNKLKELDFGPDSLQKDQILFKIFPAPMSEDDPELSDWKTAAYWRCLLCSKYEFTAYEDDDLLEIDTLPFSENYTWCTNIKYYSLPDGTSRAIASFSTSFMNDGSGRFTRGLLSLAHFEKQSGNWKLINFNLFVNYQGTFTAASPIDKVMIEGSSGHPYFIIHGGEANGVSTEEYWPLYDGLFVIDGESLCEILHIKGASCDENGPAIGSNWKTEITKIEHSSLMGTVMEIRSTGLLVKKHNWYLPEGLRFISASDFDLLPGRFNFTTSQKFFRTASELRFEKPIVSIQYTDSKGISHKQTITTSSTRIK